MTNYIDSYSGLEKTKLGFSMDSNGVYHLLDNIVSRTWLKKNKQVTVFTKLSISHEDPIKPNDECIDCTGLALTGSELNNLVLEDFHTYA